MNAFDVLFPPFCCICRKIGSYLCQQCRKKITPFIISICPQCDKPSENFLVHECCRTSNDLNGLFICVLYNEPIRTLIHQMKYAGFFNLHTFFGLILKTHLQRCPFDLDILCPVPLHPNKERKRGFNQAELLTRHTAEILHLPFFPSLLIKTKEISSQAGKMKKERINAAQCFSCSATSLCAGKRVGIIDDVTTTRSTLQRASRALKDAGAISTWGIVLAHPY